MNFLLSATGEYRAARNWSAEHDAPSVRRQSCDRGAQRPYPLTELVLIIVFLGKRDGPVGQIRQQLKVARQPLHVVGDQCRTPERRCQTRSRTLAQALPHTVS